jgi:hypothetical protein
MAHFDLWRLFAPRFDPAAPAVPIITLEDQDGNGIADGLDPALKPSLSSTAELFSFIDSELATARQLLEGQNGDAGRFTELGVVALQARVFLYSQRYEDAIDAAELVISQRNLVGIADYPQIWTDENEDENLFVIRKVPGDTDADDNIGNLFTANNGDRFFQPGAGYLELLDATNDVRYLTNIGFNASGVVVGKYPGVPGNVGLNDVKILRVSEMYLILAEAYGREGDFASATDAINTLKSNRIANYTDLTFNTFPALLDEVLLERRRELGYEGHRWFDLKRLGLDLV